MSQRATTSGYGLRSLGSALIGVVFLGSACGSGDVTASAVGINKSTHGLSLLGIESINGTYGTGCINRKKPVDGGPEGLLEWSLAMGGGTEGDLDNELLTVVKNNTACELTLTQIRTAPLPAAALAASSTIGLVGTYAGPASSFDTPIAFYANAKLSSLAFSGAFTVDVLFSDDPDARTAGQTAQFTTVSSSATGADVPAPDYTLAVSALNIQTDAANLVLAASGNALLTVPTVTGQNYMILNASGLTTYAALDDAWLAGVTAVLVKDMPAAVEGVVSIPAVDFDLVDEVAPEDLTLGVKRTLIIANESGGVRSYEAFEITFSKAVVN